MKQFILLAILLGLMSCQPKNNEVTIKGKFIGDIPEELAYSVPVNGICYDWFDGTIKPDSAGNFTFKIQTDQTCFITLFLRGNRGNLIVEPGKVYQVKIESKDNKNKLTFEGYQAQLQEAYQSLISPFLPQITADKLTYYPISKVSTQLDSMQQSELTDFESLLQEHKITPKIFQLIKLDRSLYYSTVKGFIAQYKYFSGYQNKFLTLPDSLKNMWSKALQQVPLHSTNLLRSKWAYFYLETNADFNEYSEKGFTREVYRGLTAKGLLHAQRMKAAKKYLTGSNLEFYYSAYLLSALHQNKFEKELIPLFNDFKSEYPNSKYTPYLEPYIKKAIDFHQIAKQDFSKESKFLDNYDKIMKLDECLTSFKGKKVYVDIWSTSCGSCKEEFAHNTELKKMLSGKNVEVLYIALDGDAYDIRWKDMIKYYHLTGYHIRSTYELYTDLEKRFGRFGIPRYLLIDEKGNIVIDKAKHPSQLTELEKQIDEM